MSITEYLLVAGVSLAASFLHGTTGFGFALIAGPLLSLFLPTRTAIALVLLLFLSFTFKMAIQSRRDINWKIIIWPVAASIIGRVVGVTLLMKVDVNAFRAVWGVLLILLAAYFAFFSGRIEIRSCVRNGIFSGLSAGVMGGMYNTDGPLLVIYYHSSIPERKEYGACLQASFALGALTNLPLHIYYGNINIDVLRMAAAGVVAVLIGSWLGSLLFGRLSKKLLSKMIYLLMAAMGVVQILKSLDLL